jgi:hypothetical protein
MTNKYLIHADDERRRALRAEMKRTLASLEVKSIRMAELQAVLQQLDHENELAADRHSEEAGRLQAELKSLDDAAIEAILARRPTSEKSAQRRAEILRELTKLNQILESTCEANRRAGEPIRKQISELRSEVGERQAIENRLSSICSKQTRAELLACDLLLQGLSFASAKAQDAAGIHQRNVEICIANGDERTSQADIHRAKVEDFQNALNSMSQIRADVLNRQRVAQLAALSE